MEQEKIDAFCEYFDCEEDDIWVKDNNTIRFGADNYLVYDEVEAYDAARVLATEIMNEELSYAQIPSHMLDYFDKSSYVEDTMNTELLSIDDEEIELCDNCFAYRIG